MEFLSVLRRWQILPSGTVVAVALLNAALATAILSCAPAVSIEEEAVSPTQPQASVQEKAPQPALTTKQPTLEEQPFRVQELKVQEERGQTTVRIKLSNPVAQYRHFPLTTPTRIVLDVFGDAKRMAQVENFRVGTHWISGLRLSSSEGYLRLVVEIAAAAVPPYLIEQENGGLKVIIGPVNPTHTAKKDLQLVQDGRRADVRVAEAKTPAPEAKTPTPEAKTAVPERGPSPASVPQGIATAGKKYSGQRISLDFKDADIKNVFRLLAEVSGLNIVVTGDVTRRVTLRLVDVPWDQALDLLIDTNGLGKEQIGNIVRISTAGQIKAEKDALAAAKKSEENLEALQTAYLSVNYAKVKDLVDKIKPALSPRGTIVPDDRSNTIIVRDIKSGIDEANTIVSRLDTRTPQVLIESNLIETTPTFSRALGMELNFDYFIHGNPRRPVSFDSRFNAGAPFSGSPTDLSTGIPPTIPVPTSGLRWGSFQDKAGALRNLNTVIQAAENQGDIRIISRPSVVTLNNVESTIQSLRILRVLLPSNSTSIASGTGAAAGASVATEKIPVGVTLTVTPQVSSDGFVLMNIKVKSSQLGTRSDGATIPDELSREAISNILVRDGETIVIGGIMKDTKQEAETGIPYLKDIPILGWLFKNMRWQKDFEELIVFITPRVLSGGSENLPSAEQLWREQLRKTEGG